MFVDISKINEDEKSLEEMSYFYKEQCKKQLITINYSKNIAIFKEEEISQTIDSIKSSLNINFKDQLLFNKELITTFALKDNDNSNIKSKPKNKNKFNNNKDLWVFLKYRKSNYTS